MAKTSGSVKTATCAAPRKATTRRNHKSAGATATPGVPGASGAPEHLRGFRLTVTLADGAGSSDFGLTLGEVNGNPQRLVTVASVAPSKIDRVLPHVMRALVASGYDRTVLSAGKPGKAEPLALDEDAGVRLSLVLLAAASTVRLRRVDAMADTVSAMASEEAVYWYAKAMGPNKTRVRKALRVFLADE